MEMLSQIKVPYQYFPHKAWLTFSTTLKIKEKGKEWFQYFHVMDVKK